jgi:hypothetical protein
VKHPTPRRDKRQRGAAGWPGRAPCPRFGHPLVGVGKPSMADEGRGRRAPISPHGEIAAGGQRAQSPSSALIMARYRVRSLMSAPRQIS